MANEEWSNYRERRNYPQQGLTNYSIGSNINNNNNSYVVHHGGYLHGQSPFHRAEPIHRRRAGLIDTSIQHPIYHDLSFSHLYNRGFPASESDQHRSFRDSIGDFPRTYQYHRTYRSNPYPEEDTFHHTPGYCSPHVFSASDRLYHDTVQDPDPHLHRYRLRDHAIPAYDYNQGPYRRSHSLPPLGQSTYCSTVQSAFNSDFLTDQSLSKQHTLMGHNIESQYHSPNANRPCKHNHLPISDNNKQSERIHIPQVAESSEHYWTEVSESHDNTTTRKRKRENTAAGKW